MPNYHKKIHAADSDTKTICEFVKKLDHCSMGGGLGSGFC